MAREPLTLESLGRRFKRVEGVPCVWAEGRHGQGRREGAHRAAEPEIEHAGNSVAL